MTVDSLRAFLSGVVGVNVEAVGSRDVVVVVAGGGYFGRFTAMLPVGGCGCPLLSIMIRWYSRLIQSDTDEPNSDVDELPFTASSRVTISKVGTNPLGFNSNSLCSFLYGLTSRYS